MNKAFENFQATTATELALYNEIRKLDKELYLLKLDLGIHPSYQQMPIVTRMIDVPHIKLTEFASVRGNIDHTGTIKVRSEVNFKENPKKFGCIEFTDNIYKDKFQAAGALSKLHERFMRLLAEALVREPNGF